LLGNSKCASSRLLDTIDMRCGKNGKNNTAAVSQMVVIDCRASKIPKKTRQFGPGWRNLPGKTDTKLITVVCNDEVTGMCDLFI